MEEKLPLLQNKEVKNYSALNNISLEQKINSPRGLSLQNEQLVERIAKSTSYYGPEISRAEYDFLREIGDDLKQPIIGKKVNVFSGDEAFRKKIEARFYEGFPVCCISSAAWAIVSAKIALVEGVKAVFSLKPLLCLACIPVTSCVVCSGAVCYKKCYTCYHSERAILER